jgi:iron-sulfur cluster repair protein YtfE (RIC family)
MLTRIGAARPEGDVVDLLLDCHARIRSFTALAARLAAERPPATEVREAALGIRRYFVEALPLHARDEEESLVPRLSGTDPEVDRALAAMRQQHAEHGPVLDRVVGLCDALAEAPERHDALAPELAEAAEALRVHFVGHLAPEEEIIFPAIRRLPAAERDAIQQELRARRTPPPDHSSR